LDAWLLFFSSDKAEDIIALIEQYLKFLPMYRDLYKLCRNTEAVMGLFSEELQIMDDNTVRYMIDDMQEKIDRQEETLHQRDAAIHQKDEEIKKNNAQHKKEVESLMKQIQELQAQLQTK
jgi:hypothetical protein